jgi:hypothetical protein
MLFFLGLVIRALARRVIKADRVSWRWQTSHTIAASSRAGSRTTVDYQLVINARW